MRCLSAYPQGIQDVGDFVSLVEHKRRFLLKPLQSFSFESKKKSRKERECVHKPEQAGASRMISLQEKMGGEQEIELRSVRKSTGD